MKPVLLFLMLLVGALLPEIAMAHGNVETMGNFYGGFLHPLFVPAHIIGVLLVGLLIGQNGMHNNQPAMIVFIGMLGLGLGFSGASLVGNVELLVLIFSVIAGLLVVLAAKLPSWLCIFFAAVYAFAIGLDSGPQGITGGDRLVILFGTCCGVALFFLYVVAVTDILKRPWQRVGIRVLGSWITASAMIVLALLAAGDRSELASDQAQRLATRA